MAYPTIELIDALRQTAKRLNEGVDYAWGNHGTCNCGNLLQVVANISKEEIVTYAQMGLGEWTELSEEYCHVTNTPISLMIKKLQDIGLTPTDIHNIEYLEDRQILQALPGGFRWLKKNNKNDVIQYFETMATILEEKLLATVCIPDFEYEKPEINNEHSVLMEA